MGDMRFNDKRFARSGRAAIANRRREPTRRCGRSRYYKMGWAHYDEDRFAEAADAFRSVLDLYASAAGPRIQADLQRRGGVVPDPLARRRRRRPTPRPATSTASARARTSTACWMALAQNYRRYGDLRAAAATDERCLARYPLHPDALLSAGRLIETDERAEQPQRGAFGAALVGAAVRAGRRVGARAGVGFGARRRDRRSPAARGCRSRASITGAPAPPVRARTGVRPLGSTVSLLATWPGDAEAPNLEMLHSGEASASLRRVSGGARALPRRGVVGAGRQRGRPGAVAARRGHRRLVRAPSARGARRDAPTGAGLARTCRARRGRRLAASLPDHPRRRRPDLARGPARLRARLERAGDRRLRPHGAVIPR